MTLLLSSQRAEGLAVQRQQISSPETKLSFSLLNFPGLKMVDTLEYQS